MSRKVIGGITILSQNAFNPITIEVAKQNANEKDSRNRMHILNLTVGVSPTTTKLNIPMKYAMPILLASADKIVQMKIICRDL